MPVLGTFFHGTKIYTTLLMTQSTSCVQINHIGQSTSHQFSPVVISLITNFRNTGLIVACSHRKDVVTMFVVFILRHSTEQVMFIIFKLWDL